MASSIMESFGNTTQPITAADVGDLHAGGTFDLESLSIRETIPGGVDGINTITPYQSFENN